MNQINRLNYLINYLLNESEELKEIRIPDDVFFKKQLLRSLMNIREPKSIPEEFLNIQDEYLEQESLKKGIVELSDLNEVEPGIYLYQGDITRLKVDAIINAANNQLLGCFIPCHGCIDNAIHSAAGIELRLECNEIMEKQGRAEKTGDAKITKAYNLPSRYVIHTVGPIIYNQVTQKEIEELRNCYLSCLKLAQEKNLNSIAFCCISTGEFRFPNDLAAQIAVETVREFKKNHPDSPDGIFNVFKDIDYEIYKNLLGSKEIKTEN